MRYYRITVINLLTACIMGLLTLCPPKVEGNVNPAVYFRGQLDRSQVIDAASGVSRNKYPNADIICINQHYWVEYNDDGTSVQWDEKYVKILSDEGKQQYSSISAFFRTHFKSTEILLVEVIKPDGSIISIDREKNSNITVDSSQMGSNIYDPNRKFLNVAIPHVEIGDVVHYIVKDNYFKSRIRNTWSKRINFETSDPIKRKEVTIVAPKNFDLHKIAVRSEIPGTLQHQKHQEGNHIIYNWIANDVPMAFPEQDMPPLATQTQRLLVSTIDGWESISRWYWNLSAPQIKDTCPTLEKTVSEITRGINDQRARIEAIFKWVSQEIRYLGLTTEKASPGYEPHPVKMTFERKAGVCRDKAALLAAMLRVAGFEAYPVLIRTDSKMDPDIPQPFFDHAITAVKNGDDSYLLMDSTDETTRFLLPAYLNDKSYLVATPEGENLRTTPIESVDRHMLIIDTIGNVDKNGHLSATTNIQFNGINDNIYREFLVGKSFSEMKAYFERIINKYSFYSKINDIEISPRDLMDTSIPLTIALSLESEVTEDIINDTSIIKPPFIGNNLGWVNYLTGKFGLEKRKYPLITGDACGIRENFRLKISKDLLSDIILPEFSIINDAGTTWQRKIALNGNVLSGESIFQLKLLEYNPEEYMALRENLSKIELNNNKYLIFTKKNESESLDNWMQGIKSDALVLNEINKYELEDAHNWTESNYLKLKILTYAGKKRYSDLRIDYNPAWERIKIEFARVITDSGETIDINSDEINDMDAGWAGEAPRYSSGKVMVLNFPGVDIGSIIEFKIIKSKKDRPFFTIDGSLYGSGNPFYGKSGKFRYHEPIAHKSLVVKAPKNISLNIKKFDYGTANIFDSFHNRKKNIRETRIQKGDYNIIEFTASKIAPVTREGSLPPWYSFNPTVFISSSDLKSYSQVILDQLIRKVTDSPRVKSIAKEIVKDKNNTQDIILSIRDFTDRYISYVSIPFGEIPLDNISTDEIILREGYGHIIDHAILLFSLLKASGLDPEFVLSTNTATLRELWQPLVSTPSYNWFDSILVRVATDDGYIYLNDTDRYSMLGTTTSDKYPGLVLNTAEIEKIESISTDHENKLMSQYDIKLNSDRSATIKVINEYYGNNYSGFRELSKELTPEIKRRYQLKLAAELSQRAVPLGEYFSNHEKYPGTETYSVKIENFLIDQGGYYYIKLPGLYSSIYAAYNDNRINPFYYDKFDKDYVRINIDFKDIDKQIVLSPPNTTHLRINGTGNIYINSGAITDESYSYEDNVSNGFYIEQKIDLSPFILSPKEYTLARESHAVIAHPSMNTLLFN